MDFDQRRTLLRGQVRVTSNNLSERLLKVDPGRRGRVQRIDCCLQRIRDALKDLLGRSSKAALDLGQIWSRDPHHRSYMPHGDLSEFALFADDVAQCRRRL